MSDKLLNQIFNQCLKTVGESRKPDFKGSRKPSLKSEGNEDLSSFNLKDLNVKQLDAAMENAGYTDNGIKKVTFKRVINTSGRLQFLYMTDFYNDAEGEMDKGEVYIEINKDGYVIGEPGGSGWSGD